MAFLALLILLAQNLGLGKAYPWAMLPWDLGRWIWIVVSVGALALFAEQAGLVRLGARWERIRLEAERIAGHRAVLVALILANALFAVVSWNHFQGFGYQFPWLHLIVLGACIPFVRRDRFWLSCLVSLALLAASIVHFPLDIGRSDLLPVVRMTWDKLATGTSPYIFQSFAPDGHESSMPYLPLTFFSHAPAWVLGLDLRWNQVLWRLLWMLAVGMALARLKNGSPWRTVAHLFVLNPYYNFRHDLYYEVFLAGVVAYQAWPRWRWLSLPALMWTRQWAWVMAPFLGLDWLAVREQAPGAGSGGRPLDWRNVARQAAWLALGTALVSAAVVLALAPTTTVAMFLRSVFIFQDFVKFDYGLALGPIAQKLGAMDALLPLQAILVVALGLLALWRWWQGRFAAGATEGIERLGLIALCVFILLNRFTEVYMWLEPSMWMLAAYATRDAQAG